MKEYAIKTARDLTIDGIPVDAGTVIARVRTDFPLGNVISAMRVGNVEPELVEAEAPNTVSPPPATRPAPVTAPAPAGNNSGRRRGRKG